MNETVEITETMFRQYEQVKNSGVTNMIKKSNVREAAINREFYELASLIDSGNYYDFLQNYEKYENKFKEI